jgi:hypothetical protein
MARAQKKRVTKPARAAAPAVSQEEISREAFKLFQARHGAPGDPIADWFEAERIVRSRAQAAKPRVAAASASAGGGRARRSRTTSRRRR